MNVGKNFSSCEEELRDFEENSEYCVYPEEVSLNMVNENCHEIGCSSTWEAPDELSFQMMYHLFQKSFGKVVKINKIFFGFHLNCTLSDKGKPYQPRP